ncbi:dnaJ homolog subfamily B member 9 [Colletes latitarsis]|uniref:dnaJ homolog subfamily B member 9 n=1 Tax=Colletes latitarsis TaxID=2605962 RepID=UPI00403501B4
MNSMNYYDVLGCTRESTSEDIKRAYHALALKFHPDKNVSEFDGIKFQHIVEAWNVLRDPKSREEYDAIQKCGGQYYVQREYLQEKNQLIHVPCLECTFVIVIET